MQNIIRTFQRKGLHQSRQSVMNATKTMTLAPQFNFATGKILL